MNKKGFTLIELLAVIVVLAIILLIAMPIVLDVINDAREGAFNSTGYGLVKSAETEFYREALDTSVAAEVVTYTFSDDGTHTGTGLRQIDFSGSSPKAGTIVVDTEGNIAMAVTDGTYCSVKTASSTEVLTYDWAGLQTAFPTQLATPNTILLDCNVATLMP